MGAPQFAVYSLCFLTGGLCAWLLLKAYPRRRDRLLLWSCLYFSFLTLNSFITLMDFVLPAYDHVVKASHRFNVLDARGAISVTERQRFIGRVRALARAVAEAWLAQREALGFPLLREQAKAAE